MNEGFKIKLRIIKTIKIFKKNLMKLEKKIASIVISKTKK